MNKELVISETQEKRRRVRKRGKPKPPASRKQQRRRNRQNPLGPIGRSPLFRLSDCTAKYLRALTDPFTPLDAVCIPDLVDTPSLKSRVIARGTFTCGSASRGFVLVNPAAACANDTDSICYTTGDFAGTTLPANSAAITGVVDTQFAQSPKNGVDIGLARTDHQTRPVACGIRVRYVGTELARGGRMVPVRTFRNIPVASYTLNQLLDWSAITSKPVTRKWSAVSYIPVTTDEFGYIAQALDTTTRYPVTFTGTIGWFVDSDPNNTFEFEIVLYAEYCGNTFGITASHSDVAGMSTVRNFLERNVPLDAGESVWNDAVKFVNQISWKDVSGFAGTAASLGKASGLI